MSLKKLNCLSLTGVLANLIDRVNRSATVALCLFIAEIIIAGCLLVLTGCTPLH